MQWRPMVAPLRRTRSVWLSRSERSWSLSVRRAKSPEAHRHFPRPTGRSSFKRWIEPLPESNYGASEPIGAFIYTPLWARSNNETAWGNRPLRKNSNRRFARLCLTRRVVDVYRPRKRHLTFLVGGLASLDHNLLIWFHNLDYANRQVDS